MKVYFIKNTDNGKFIEANHPGTLLCFTSRVAADTEIDYKNHKSPSAEMREKFVVEPRTI